MKLLLVEDDIEISQMLKSYLEAENYEVICTVDGEEACEKFEKESYSLVLLDLMIPKISGMEVMQHIRTHSTVPIIIVSAKDTDADKTLGLGLGADDYITKPFSVTEVLARIKANIRRSTQYSKPEEQEVLMMGDHRSRISDVPPSASALRYYLAGCRILLRTGTGSGRIYRVLSLAALCLVGVELRQKQSVILDFDHAALIHRHLYRILLSGKRTFSD